MEGFNGSDGSDGSGTNGNGGDGSSNSGDESTATTGSGKEITLMTQQSSPGIREVWESLAQSFNNETGHTVKYRYTTPDDLIGTISSEVGAGNAPELLMGTSSRVGPLAAADLMRPTEEVIQNIFSSSEREDFSSSLIKRNGKPRTIPLFYNVWSHVARKDLLEEAGFDIPDGHNTFQPIDNRGLYTDWIQQIKEETGVDGVAFATGESSRGSSDMVHLLKQNGVKFFEGSSDDLELVLDKGQNRERAIEMLKTLRDDMIPYGNHGQLGWTDMQTLYANGEVAMLWYRPGRWAQMLLEQDKPERLRNTIFVPNPRDAKNQAHGGATTRRTSGYLGLLKGSENPDVAKEFVKFFIESDHYYDFLYGDPLDRFPPSVEKLQSDRYRNYSDVHEVVNKIRPDVIEYFAQTIEQKIAAPWPFTDPGGGYNNIYSQLWGGGTFGSIGARLTAGGQDPGTAIDQTASVIRNDFL